MHYETLERLIGQLSNEHAAPKPDSLYIKDWQLIWWTLDHSKEHDFFVTQDRRCQMVMTAKLTKVLKPNNLVSVFYKPYRALANWELGASGIIFCPKFCYLRFATMGGGQERDLVFTGIARLGGELYEKSYVNIGKRVLGWKEENLRLYEDLCRPEGNSTEVE